MVRHLHIPVALLALSIASGAASAPPAHPLPGIARSLAGLAPAPGPVLAPAGTDPEELPSGGELLRGDARRALAAVEPAGLVVVLSPVGGAEEVAAPRPGDASLYTREAFAEAWAAVAPGGWLAWIAGDEQVFLRGITAIVEARRAERPGAAAFGQGAWGWRLVREEAPASPYRLLCLVPRNPVTPASAAELLRVSRALPLRELFGPGADVKNRYEPLSDPEGPVPPETMLVQMFSVRAGEHVLAAPATDDGPPVFQVRAARPAAENGTLVIASVALIGVLLLPLGSRRHIGAPEAGRSVPLPLTLGEAPFGVLLAGVGTALALRSAVFRGGADVALIAVPLAAVAGALLSRFFPPRPALLVVPLAAAAALAVGFLAAAPAVRTVAGAAIALGLGLGAGSQLRLVLSGVDRALARWVLVAWAIALAASPALAARMVHDLGAAASAAVLAAGWGLALAACVPRAGARGSTGSRSPSPH